MQCPECRAEYLLAFSCKTRELCPSCAARRVPHRDRGRLPVTRWFRRCWLFVKLHVRICPLVHAVNDVNYVCSLVLWTIHFLLSA
ncbi:MAG: hypothetical protein IFJ96_05985 [Acidobacteria bacterium]|nr:hypothetical protein [Candidatus Sulfomarinibacter sp. MAG AM2]